MLLEIGFFSLLLLQVSRVWATSISSCTIDSSFTTFAVSAGDSGYLKVTVASGSKFYLYDISFGSTQSDSFSVTDASGTSLGTYGSSCTSYTPNTAYVVTGYQANYVVMTFTCNNYFASCNLAYKANSQFVTSSPTLSPTLSPGQTAISPTNPPTAAPTSFSSSSSTNVSVSVSQTNSSLSPEMFAVITGGAVAILGGFGLFCFCRRRRTKLATSATGGNTQNSL